jgi:general secretion pathway protein D
VKTQITMQDGDTIAIAGIISEDSAWTSQGIPFLHRIPVIGSFFGSQSLSKSRQEIIVFITPRVIYDTNELADASDELKAKLRKLRNTVKE